MGPTFEKNIILLCNNSCCFRQENQSDSVWSVYNCQERFTETVAIMISAPMQAPFLTTSWEVNGTLEHIVNFSYFSTVVDKYMTGYHLIEIERE
jgi:hypothetical protein